MKKSDLEGEIGVRYEDPDFLVVKKPSGVQVHPDKHNKNGTLTDFLLKKYPEIKAVGEDPVRPGIVHRLDRDTSGIMLIARNNDAFYYFKKQFQLRKIKKTYWALVHGILKKQAGMMDAPIGISLGRKVRRSVDPRARGKKEAATRYRVIAEYDYLKIKAEKEKLMASYTLVEAKPITGRTHQIRVHLKALGHPIAGDRIYKFKRMIDPPGLNRLFLVAKKIGFVDRRGARREFDEPLEEKLEEVIRELRERTNDKTEIIT